METVIDLPELVFLIDLPQLRTEISHLKESAAQFKLFTHVIAVPRDRITIQSQKP